MDYERELAFSVASLLSPVLGYLPYALFGILFDGSESKISPFIFKDRYGNTYWLPTFNSKTKEEEFHLWLAYAASLAATWPKWNTKMETQTLLPLAFTAIWYHCDRLGGKCGSFAVTQLCKAMASCPAVKAMIMLSTDLRGARLSEELRNIVELASKVGETTYNNVVNCLVPALS